ncbi:MAG: hypothetical protein JXB88_09905 [Spirochaetales bacterium]|nr:hypothetical protein [Spirochaetales bacterium]
MKKLKLYLDTSVINFIFADDAPEKQRITIDFFENSVETGRYDVYISDIVYTEIEKTRDLIKKKKLISVINDYNLIRLPGEHDEEVRYLSKIYIEKKVIPVSKIEDALHVAYAVVFQIDYLLSWNYKHLVNINREKKIILINKEENYNHFFRIITPIEVAYE